MFHHLSGQPAWNLSSVVTCSVHAERVRWWRDLYPLLGRVSVHYRVKRVNIFSMMDRSKSDSLVHLHRTAQLETQLQTSGSTPWLNHYLCAPPQVTWEGWGSPKTWQVLAGKQALGGHPSRRQCSGRTPQGPRQGYQTGVPGPGRLGRSFAHHLHKTKHGVSEKINTKRKP